MDRDTTWLADVYDSVYFNCSVKNILKVKSHKITYIQEYLSYLEHFFFFFLDFSQMYNRVRNILFFVLLFFFYVDYIGALWLIIKHPNQKKKKKQFNTHVMNQQATNYSLVMSWVLNPTPKLQGTQIRHGGTTLLVSVRLCVRHQGLGHRPALCHSQIKGDNNKVWTYATAVSLLLCNS